MPRCDLWKFASASTLARQIESGAPADVYLSANPESMDFLEERGAESGVTALYGVSGAGKTSVVNMVAGLMRPDSGRIAVNGFCLFDSAKGLDLPPEKRRIGYVFQDGRLFPHLTVRANLGYGMLRTPFGRRFVKFDPVVELLGIGHLLHRTGAAFRGRKPAGGHWPGFADQPGHAADG